MAMWAEGGGDPISLQRQHPDRADRAARQATSNYTFEHLEAAVAELLGSRRLLRDENAELRTQILQQNQRMQGLDERLLEANQRRQDALKRVDDLISRLDQIDSRFEGLEDAPRASALGDSKRPD